MNRGREGWLFPITKLYFTIHYYLERETTEMRKNHKKLTIIVKSKYTIILKSLHRTIRLLHSCRNHTHNAICHNAPN